MPSLLESLSQSRPLILPELTEYRRATSLRHATAFCDAPDYVTGIQVLPLTPRTWSMLYAINSRFVHGGLIGEGDVRNFIWFHSPLYADLSVKGWQARKSKALRPLEWMLTTHPLRQWLVKPSPSRYAAVLKIATDDIRQIFNQAFGAAETGHGRPTKPIASMEAQLIHAFALAYRWEPEKTRNYPLRKLFQLLRCIRASNGGETRDTGEEEILERHLQRRLATIEAARAADKAEGGA